MGLGERRLHEGGGYRIDRQALAMCAGGGKGCGRPGLLYGDNGLGHEWDKERAGQGRQAQGMLHAHGKPVDPRPEVYGFAVQVHGQGIHKHAHGDQVSRAVRRAATQAGGTEDDNVIETWPMVSVTVSAVDNPRFVGARPIGAGTPRGVTVTGTKAAGGAAG